MSRNVRSCAEESGKAHASEREVKVVICGGGIIGTAIAYYLARRGQRATVVERASVAAAASGRAGGFLALDWNDTSCVGPLSRASYALHAGLEEELGVPLDYRQMDTFSVSALQQGGLLHQNRGFKGLPKWIDGHVVGANRLGSKVTTAQVNPRKLTEAFLSRATALVGTSLHIGAVNGVATKVVEGGGQTVTGVRVADDLLPADIVIFALGPWSNVVSAWLPMPLAVSGQRYHSVVVKSGDEVDATALFTNVRASAGGKHHDPEIYPRPNNEIYLCGEPDSHPLPADPTAVAVRSDVCDRLVTNCSAVATCLKGAEVVKKQACYLPLTTDGVPMIGAIDGVSGSYVATGHSCWGILNAPATGLAMAELLLDGEATSVDLRPFAPARFR